MSDVAVANAAIVAAIRCAVRVVGGDGAEGFVDMLQLMGDAEKGEGHEKGGDITNSMVWCSVRITRGK